MARHRQRQASRGSDPRADLVRLKADVVLLRHKREHSEEYLDPAKVRPYYASEQVAANAVVMTPPEWSSSINGVRRLGGRIVVTDLGAALECLCRELVAADRWELPWTPAELVATEKTLGSAA